MAQTTEQFLQAFALIQANAVPLWPGFMPARTPCLVFDGRDTWLLHADPPSLDGWYRQGGRWTFTGRHPQVLANTAVLLDGLLPAATILLSELSDHFTSRQLAAFAVHEAFHVHQGQHPSPAWTADELSGLTYPFGDEEVLVARAMETRALHRALHGEGDGLGWAAVALGWRQERFTRLSVVHQAYERSMERVEGLAHHVERRFLNEPPCLDLPDVPTEQIRKRAYTVGAAYAALLDRAVLDWPVAVQASGIPLDVLLAGVVAPVRETAAVPGEIRRWASEEAQGVAGRQQEALDAFGARPGGRLLLTVADGSEPLWPRGFDPLNLRVLADGSLLHTRFLQFGNGTVSGELLGATCRSWGMGTHAFASGFRQIELVGVDWSERGTSLEVSGPGVSVKGSRGRFRPDGNRWRWEIGQ